MHAKVGDTLHIHARQTDSPDQWGRIVEIRGTDGTPPYLVEFPDGHVGLLFPGPDAVVEPGNAPAARSAQHAGHGRRVHTLRGW
ncbi:MAG TPA: DUF1918 domain-containing protein [Actinocrinis sp.]|nr:DUF1918 domain-containing protein [Actinocrinis sp.]